MTRLRSTSPAETSRLGKHLGALLAAGDVVCLSGGLGAGKTGFCRGIGIGYGARTQLTSPSYNLVHEHQRAEDATRLYHLDCYRLDDAMEAPGLGIDDILDGSGIVVIEWAGRIEPFLPAERLWIDFDMRGETSRDLHCQAVGERHIARLAGWLRALESDGP
ncbi:MAG: tRNA (adenosine(37)-N6)-threonylcarbamoyltransferase complex ATPase subunit type 1 TsaE [Chloroflexi bacterium]|nr:tRNA (adenosine(37)-N6)-threonylcarbamoyltransferase complex ATPase subunit type 1 TsaE [Chloroflexota bacterium]MCY3717781.1 tRNA (adenosine(37)-N6)-threonylcarbamoyltransferase complex ATPase subunit type 1 TsaE [Chloroflexota bacterium]MDE2651466.1 tRNA (adenosine(37)-N6)-threonylcarbamoyltransferase complex ATPase subunit type 1 TsaE [Chloroflexota bacterium]MYA92723.1 tRNA (adenosine(37)-N6)-threonylcarbamoyltransferase complex ATPase subunit type 1 TsaE [Chloroflexota bacterium]MYH6510